MSKGLEALEKVEDFYLDYAGFDETGEYKTCISLYQTLEYQVIRKELTALEIIKDFCNLKVYKNKLGQCFIEGTNILFAISKEKYDLLKEVLL